MAQTVLSVREYFNGLRQTLQSYYNSTINIDGALTRQIDSGHLIDTERIDRAWNWVAKNTLGPGHSYNIHNPANHTKASGHAIAFARQRIADLQVPEVLEYELAEKTLNAVAAAYVFDKDFGSLERFIRQKAMPLIKSAAA